MKLGNKEFTNSIELIGEHNGRIGRLIIPVPDIEMYFKWDDSGSYSMVHINDVTVKELSWKKTIDVVEKNDEIMVNEVKPKHVRFHKYFAAVRPTLLPKLKNWFEKQDNIELSAEAVLRAIKMVDRMPNSALIGLKFVLWFEKIAVELKSRNNNKIFIFRKVDENYRLPKDLEELAKHIELAKHVEESHVEESHIEESHIISG